MIFATVWMLDFISGKKALMMAFGLILLIDPWWNESLMLFDVIGGMLLFSSVVSVLRLVYLWPIKSEQGGRLKINFELTGYEDMLKVFSETTRDVVLALFACVLFIGSCMLSSADIQPKTPDGQPLVAAVGMILSIALALFTIRHMSRKK